MADDQITETERRMMTHALGFARYHDNTIRPRWARRNYFATSKGGDDCAVWESLEARGLAIRNPRSHPDLPDAIYHVSRQGVAALGPTIGRRIPKDLNVKDGKKEAANG
jgi:hypothetical protein